MTPIIKKTQTKKKVVFTPEKKKTKTARSTVKIKIATRRFSADDFEQETGNADVSAKPNPNPTDPNAKKRPLILEESDGGTVDYLQRSICGREITASSLERSHTKKYLVGAGPKSSDHHLTWLVPRRDYSGQNIDAADTRNGAGERGAT